MFFKGIATFLFLIVFVAPVYAAGENHGVDHGKHHAAAATYSLKAGEEKLKKGELYSGSITLKDSAGKAVSLDGLKEVHTQKIHALVVDQSLGDYHHLHPEYTGKDGVYTFSFTPGSARDYKLWVDIAPTSGAPQLVSVMLPGTEPCAQECVEKTLNDRGEFFTSKAVVTFDKPPAVGVQSVGMITLTDPKGAPIRNLEPVMGAYAHVVGFYDDFATVQHLHPQGDEPSSADARGASPLTFALTPEKAGFLKYFVQLRVNGQDVFLPMGVDIK